MAHTITHPEVSYQYHMAVKKPSAILRFFKWAANEDAEHHIAWVGASITSMTAVFFPLAMTFILLNGAMFGLIIAAMTSLVLVVITNLAAMPTKYTIPFFFLGILIDVVTIALSFYMK